MESNPVVFDISSDDDDEVASGLEESKGDDYDWFSEVLEAVNKGFDDSDEVVVIGEVNPNKKSKTRNSSVRKDVTEEDDDCIVLEGDPEKAVSDVNDYHDGSDELLVVGHKGQVACRDFPHPRHDCAKFPFSSTSHDQHCELCHCFVCDVRAPCCYWGSGITNTDHCHATDKEEIWSTLRKNFRHGRNVSVPPVTSHSTIVPQHNHVLHRDIIRLTTQNHVSRPTPVRASGNCIPQNNVPRPSIIRACSSSSTKHGVPYNPTVGSRHVLNRSTIQPRSGSQELLGVRNSVIQRDRGTKTRNMSSQFVSSNTMSKRLDTEVPYGSVNDQNVNNPTNVGVGKQNEASGNSQSVPYIYRQDVVRSNINGSIGIVSEVAGDSDSDGSITDDEDDEDEDKYNEDGEDESGDVDANSNANGSGEGNKGDRDYKCGDLQADQIRVLWMDDTEPVQSIKNVTVVDRGFLHGDYVAAASNSTGQVGVVVDVNISIDLLAPDGSTIKDISTRDLQRVRDFAVGDYVVLGPWLGRIDDVLDNVNVLFDDGSECKVMRAEPLRLKPTTRNTLEDDSNFPYYPGQRVKASSSSVFKNSRWLSGLWKPNRLEGTVTKVTAGSVFIYWIASAGYGPDSSTAPAEEQNPKNLRLLSCFTHANWQVGDWCLLPTSLQSIPLDKGFSNLQLNGSMRNGRNHECDSEEVTPDEPNDNTESMDLDEMPTPDENNAIVETKDNGNVENKVSLESSSCSSSLSASKETVHEHWPLHRKKVRKVVIRKDKKAKKKGDNFERAFLIVNSRTRVDVAWQDGTVERGVDATKLVPIETPGDHEFVAEQYVVEKTSDDGDDVYEPRRVGVVKSVNAKERTACVKWLKPVARAEDPREFDKEEIVSVYELEGHPDYDYCYGDVVVRLPPASFPIQSASEEGSLKEPKQEDGSKEVKLDFQKHSGSNRVEGAPLNAFFSA